MSHRSFAWLIVALLLTTVAPQTWAVESAPEPAYRLEGSRWNVGTPSISADEVDRFNTLWTARFADMAGLNAYLAEPGVYDDGYNALSDSDKAALIVGLFEYWRTTIPDFAQGFWTGEAAEDQKSFEELMTLMYATVFAKDEFFGKLREAANARPMVGPPAPQDAGIEYFPGLSQEDITAYVDGLHVENAVITEPPALPTLEAPAHMEPVSVDVPVAPGAPPQVVLADPTRLLEPETHEMTVVELSPVARLRTDAQTRTDPPIVITPPTLPDLDSILALLPEIDAPTPPEVNQLLNLVAGGTYLACGGMGASVQCAPVPVPLGVPVPLDLDANPLTGVAGAEVTVLLTPTANPDFLVGGFAVTLQVARTQPSTLLGGPLPAQAYVVYTAPGAATQILAGFDGRMDTLADTQSVVATLKDVALALTGDVRLRADITREGPGDAFALIAGFSRVDPTQYPLMPRDPTTLALKFDPAPDSVRADLRFADNIIEGDVTASQSPTVTASIQIAQGDERRTMLGLVESMPTQLSFDIVSEALGAVSLDYAANAPFPRFELHDVLVFDIDQPNVRSTLDAVVHGVPATIGFDIERPFGVTYTASARVTDATMAIQRFDNAGLVSSIGAHVEGIPSQWSIDGDNSPLLVEYTANGNIDLITATMYDRASAMNVAALVEDIPNALTLSVANDRLLASAVAPIGKIEASARVGSLTPVWLTGEFASLRTNGAGSLAAATRVLGFQSLDYDTRTVDHTKVNVRIAGGEPFTARIDTPDAYVNAWLSNLPTNIAVDLGESTFSYDFAQAVSNVTVHAEVGDLAADVIVNDLPSSLDVSWNQTSLVYDANTAITRVRAWIAMPGVAAFADVQSIPADFSVSWPSGTASFSTPGVLGSVLVQASVNGGTITALAGDHASLNKAGSAIGASLKLTGIKAASIDPRNGGNYSLTLSPGGQTFRVGGNIDGLVVAAYVSNLPTTIALDLRHGNGKFAYNASTPITRVWASADAATGPLYAYADLNGLPARVNIDWTLGSSPSITYNASSTVTSIYGYFVSTTGAAYEGSITSLPAWMKVAVGSSSVTFDARTAWNAAAASGVVGTITARYASDGAFLYGSGNYANVYQTATITRASLGYNGLKAIEVSQVNDNLVVDVQNSAPRYFTAYADTVEAYASIVVDSIPAHVRITGVGTTFTYNAYGQTITTIGAYFWDRESLTVDATINSIPGSATIDLNMPSSAITYSASSAIGVIDIDVWYGVWYGHLGLSSVPTSWTVTFGSGDYKFDAGAGSIGSVQAIVTNHGSYTTLSGNHVNLNYVQGSGGPPPADAGAGANEGAGTDATSDVIDASLLMTAVQKAQYKRVGSNNEIDLRMGGNTPFTARADVEFASGVTAYLYVTFTPLPASIQASFGERTTITTNTNFNLYAYGEYGTVAALTNAPSPPYVHGASVRDGASGSARAIKAQIYLTGLPTSVNIDPKNGTFAFTNWKPTTSTLVIDGQLDNLLATPVTVYVQQSGIPNPQSLNFSMKSEDVSGTKRVDVDLTQTAGMGALYADATFGNNHGRLTVSNIPDDIHALYEIVNGGGKFVWDATAPINNVYAGFRVITQSASFQGYVNLAQLPSDFQIDFGRAAGGQGPTLSYTANANTLDITTYVDASLFGGDLKARLSFNLVNLGSDVDVYVSGTGVRFTSTPATSMVYAAVWADYDYYTSSSGIWDEGGFLEYPWAYHLGVYPTVYNLQVTLTNFSDFSLAWGVTSKMSGSYGTFSFSWDQINVYLDVYGSIRVVVDWPWPFGSSDINLVNAHVHQTITVNALFHTYTNHQAYWFGTSGSVICDWSLSTSIRPHPHGASWNGLSVTAASAEGGAWYATPNPWGTLPSWVMDLATRYSSPDGGGVGLSFDFNC